VSALASLIPLAAEVHDTAEEGRNIILSMLVVGLIFVGVIALGEFSKYLLHRRR
jgi:hypothetical protein